MTKQKIYRKEADVKAEVKSVLKDSRVAWWFMPPANGYGRSGIPDFVGCVRGCMFAIETKFGRGTTTANQEREIFGLRTAGAQVWIVNEHNIDQWILEFEAWMELCS